MLMAAGHLLATIDSAHALSDRERRCVTMVAWAEAAAEGTEGMRAVMNVVGNRMEAHPRFPKDACQVVLQDRQFQPVKQRASLRRALHRPDRVDMHKVLKIRGDRDRAYFARAWAFAPSAVGAGKDPTRGALYFVNPKKMDRRFCPWFAELKRTTVIGRHVFLTHYQPGERRKGPALDCRSAGKGKKSKTQLAAKAKRGSAKPARQVAAAAHGSVPVPTRLARAEPVR
jgi:spore germination cell wall hydrolase CwlJ-like protein